MVNFSKLKIVLLIVCAIKSDHVSSSNITDNEVHEKITDNEVHEKAKDLINLLIEKGKESDKDVLSNRFIYRVIGMILFSLQSYFQSHLSPFKFFTKDPNVSDKEIHEVHEKAKDFYSQSYSSFFLKLFIKDNFSDEEIHEKAKDLINLLIEKGKESDKDVLSNESICMMIEMIRLIANINYQDNKDDKNILLALKFLSRLNMQFKNDTRQFAIPGESKPEESQHNAIPKENQNKFDRPHRFEKQKYYS